MTDQPAAVDLVLLTKLTDNVAALINEGYDITHISCAMVDVGTAIGAPTMGRRLWAYCLRSLADRVTLAAEQSEPVATVVDVSAALH